MSHNVIELNEKNFEKEVLKSNIPVIVDFWAEWCVPCRQVTPVLEDFAKETRGKIKIGKINVDDNVEITTKYGILSIPTLLFFKDGEILGNLVGAVSKDEIEEKLNEIG